jgi:serralysin
MLASWELITTSYQPVATMAFLLVWRHNSDTASCSKRSRSDWEFSMPKKLPVYSDEKIANQLTRSGVYWGPQTDGQGNTLPELHLTYSFNDISTAGNALDDTHKVWIRNAIAVIEETYMIDMTEVASNGDFTFNGTSGKGTFAGMAWDGDLHITDVDIEFDMTWETNASAELGYGSYGYGTIMHELLHGFGLDHPGNYDASQGTVTYGVDAVFKQDTVRNTIMSYFSADADGSGTSFWVDKGDDFEWMTPQTPMVYDYYAMSVGSAVSGVPGYAFRNTVRNGDTTYGYNATVGVNQVYDFTVNSGPILTIYDSGGTDTLDLSGDIVEDSRVVSYNKRGEVITTDIVRTTSVIDLREFAYSSTHGMKSNIGIAFGAVIENAIGTVFKDTMYGNNVSNTLQGGDGADTLYGFAGFDILEGGKGADTIDGGADFDIAGYASSDAGVSINLNNGKKNTGGDAEGDKLVSIEAVYGSTYEDRFVGDKGINHFFGDEGDDVFVGGGGADALFGGGGGQDMADYSTSKSAVTVDLLAEKGTAGDAAGDTLVEIEWLTGSKGKDILLGDNIANKLLGMKGNDIIDGRGGEDILNGGAGNDVMTGGAGADIFQFTDLKFRQDVITDWEDGVDHLSFAGLNVNFASFQIAQVGDDTVLTAIGHTADTITLKNVLVSAIDQGDFL